jgi:hypothetical protein
MDLSLSEREFRAGVEHTLADIAAQFVPSAKVYAILPEGTGYVLELLLATVWHARDSEERIHRAVAAIGRRLDGAGLVVDEERYTGKVTMRASEPQVRGHLLVGVAVVRLQPA